MSKQRKKIKHLPERVALLCAGIVVTAFGVAFSIKAALGTSPISAVPTVTSAISGLSVGVTTIILNFLFVVIQIALLRKSYQWIQVLQFLIACLFGLMIDVAEIAIESISYSSYWEQWLWCFVGIIFLAAGVSMQVTADLIPNAGEGIVLAICRVTRFPFGNVKIAFDVTLVVLAIILSLVFLGRLEGVREGTIVAAFLVGLFAKQANKLFGKLSDRYVGWKNGRHRGQTA